MTFTAIFKCKRIGDIVIDVRAEVPQALYKVEYYILFWGGGAASVR